jgi:hypothetical protein
MPRTDVPAPGQGKRGRRKAWRDNADQTIAIYGLAVEETPETKGTEDLETLSQVFPYWDDDIPQPQPQSQSPQPQQHYTEEEAQELVEKAYQEGWQQGMEEGYRLGKDKGYKEYKVQVEEEEAKKAKNQARKDVAGYLDTLDTPGNVTSIDATPQMDSAAPEARTSTRTTHTTSTPPNSITTATKRSKSTTAASRSSTSSISLTYSSPKAQIVEITDSTVYNSPTSPNTTQTARLSTENISNDVSDSYVVYFDSQTASSSNQSELEKTHHIDTQKPESTILDTQCDSTTVFLVDLDVQTYAPAPGTIPDTVDASKTPLISIPHYQLPPLPSLQPLHPSLYKRQDIHTTTCKSLAAPQNDPSASKKPKTAHSLTQNGQFYHPILPNPSNIAPLPSEQLSTTSYDPTQPRTAPITTDNSQIIDSDIPILAHPGILAGDVALSVPLGPAFQYPTASAAIPTIIIHAQTVVIGGPASSNISTEPLAAQKTFNGERSAPPTDKRTSSTRNSAGNPQVPVSPFTPTTPPRDLSVLRSCYRPFSSLRRRSRRRQSMPARGLNWDSNFHYGNFSQAPRWVPPTR